MQLHLDSSFSAYGNEEQFEAALLALEDPPRISAPAPRPDGELDVDLNVKPETVTARKGGTEGPELTARVNTAPHDYVPEGFGGIGSFMANKRRKLKVQYDNRVDQDKAVRPQIFAGLSIYINGLVKDGGYAPLAENLVLHGGNYISYLDRKSLVTHIVAEVLTPKKRAELVDYKVATPAWLLQSIAAGKLLDWRDFRECDAADTHVAKHGEADRMGTQIPQKSLLSMGMGAKSKPALQRKPKDKHRPFPLASPPTDLVAVPPRPPSPKSIPTLEPVIPALDPPKGYSAYLPARHNPKMSELLYDREWMAKNTSSCPTYLANYFAQSRLHHLSTWKQELLVMVANRQADLVRPLRKKPLTGTAEDGRTIMHADFDCFFVACGLISRPHLKDLPVAVCHALGSGAESLSSTSEIASGNYLSRAYGIKAGMSLGRAKELCSNLQTMPFEFDLYRTISGKFYDILLRHSDLLQAVSIDEALLDVSSKFDSSSTHDVDDPALAYAHELRREIKEATGIQVSIGISHNILLARMATSKAKPSNAYHLLPDAVPEFLAPLPLQALHGLAYRTSEKAEAQLGITTLGELGQVRRSEMVRVFGESNGVKFEKFAKGIDDTELRVGAQRMSVSAECNYGIRFTDSKRVQSFMYELGNEVAKRLRALGNYKARAIVLKVMQRDPHSPAETPKFLGHGQVVKSTASASITSQKGGATDDGDVIGAAAWRALHDMNIEPEKLRGLAIQATKLEVNGLSTEAVLERGQVRLSFGAAAPLKLELEPAMPAVIPARPLTRPPPRHATRASAAASTSVATTTTIIILSSDSETETPVNKSKLSEKPTRMARLFQVSKRNAESRRKVGKSGVEAPTADTVRDEDLVALGLNVDDFRSFPDKIQREVLQDYHRRGVKFGIKPAAPAPPTHNATLPTVAAAPSPPLSPSMLDDDILTLKPDLHIPTFRELPRSMQRDQLNDLKQRKGLLSVAGVSRARLQMSTPTVQTVQLKVVPLPALHGRTSVDEIEAVIEGWVSAWSSEIPDARDVAEIQAFVTKCLDVRLGQDLSKAVRVVNWWKYLLDLEFGADPFNSVGIAWMDAWRTVKSNVEKVTRHQFGASIMF